MASRSERSGFGGHLTSLREARGFTQEVLAERSGLSPDTIRRLEYNDFSPSLDTIRRLAAGLEIQLSTLFEAYEVGQRNAARELVDMVAGRSDADVATVTEVVRTLLRELDAREAK